MEQNVRLVIDGEEKVYPKGTTFLQIAKEYQKNYTDDIILVLVGSRLRELGKVVDEEGELSFVTTADKIGKKTYRRSVILLMQKAIHNLYGADGIDVRVKYSIGQGYYCELVSKTDSAEKATAFLPQHVAEIKAEMLRMVKEDIPIKKESWNTDKAVELFK